MYIPVKYNTPVVLTALVLEKDSTSQKVNPTIASGDVTLSIDNGAYQALSSTPTVTPTSGISIQINLTAAETSGKIGVIRLSDVAGDEWSDNAIAFSTYGDANAFEVFDRSQSEPQVYVSGMADNVITEAKIDDSTYSKIANEVTVSGTSAGFDNVADLTATNSKIDNIAVSGYNWITASGWPETSDMITAFDSRVIDGTGGNQVTASGYYKYSLSRIRGDINHTPSGNNYYQEFLDADGGSLFTELVTPTGRFLQ